MFHLFTRREANALRVTMLVCFLSRMLLMLRPIPQIATRPYIEDSFYVFSCARQLALGHGFSVDGVHLTNGVQPLIVLLYAPLFYLFGDDRFLALRSSFVLNALIDVCAVYLFALVIRSLERMSNRTTASERSTFFTAPIIGAVLWTVLMQVLIQTMNGLETGLYSLLLLVSIYYYIKIRENPPSLVRYALFGGVLGLLILARIDGAFFAVGYALAELYRLRAKAIAYCAVMAVVATTITAPWWLYSYHTFGSFMPISGQAESLGSGANLLRSFVALSDIIATIIYLPFYSPILQQHLWLFGVWMAVAASILYLVFIAWNGQAWLRSSKAVLTPFFIGCFCIWAYYTFFFSASHFIPRYFQPLRILWLLLFALTLAEIVRTVSISRTSAIMRCVMIGMVIFTVGFNGRMYLYNYTVGKISELYLAGMWAKAHPADRVGMDQSGTAGFVADNVVNLDGKVNAEALQALHHHTMGEYLKQSNITYLADWPEFVAQLSSEAEKAGVHYAPVDSIYGSTLIIAQRQ